MRNVFTLSAAAALVASMLFGQGSALATTFCNMDEAGGDKGRDAHRRSAQAAATFFLGAALTFEMFAHLERYSGGEKEALRSARDLGGKAVEMLSGSARQFHEIGAASDAIRSVDVVLKLLRPEDYAAAFKMTAYSMDLPLAKQIRAEFERANTASVMKLCAETVENLTRKDSAMGEVFGVVRNSEPPTAEKMWLAVVQWNEGLIKGRIVSAIFKVAGKLKP